MVDPVKSLNGSVEIGAYKTSNFNEFDYSETSQHVTSNVSCSHQSNLQVFIIIE